MKRLFFYSTTSSNTFFHLFQGLASLQIISKITLISTTAQKQKSTL